MDSQLTPSNRGKTLNHIVDPEHEPFIEVYSAHLNELNAIIEKSGEEFKGSVFYNNRTSDFSQQLFPGYREKRRTLALLANAFLSICEIGFNPGHSALLLLSSNPDLKLVSIDIGFHSSTLPCYEYLKSIFRDRINLILSNSLTAFPLLHNKFDYFDCYLIDGAHGLETAEADLLNCISYTPRGTKILFDDADWKPPLPPLHAMISIYIAKGLLMPLLDPQGYLHNNN